MRIYIPASGGMASGVQASAWPVDGDDSNRWASEAEMGWTNIDVRLPPSSLEIPTVVRMREKETDLVLN